VLLNFAGAAGTVTGSKYLIENRGRRILVDCGLFQGLKALRLKNWSPLSVSPEAIDAVVLTHAHIDHSGYLPLLCRDGFKGPIFCTPATEKLCALLLPDAGRLQEEEAGYANRRGYSKHHPALPLFTEADARACLSRFSAVPFGKKFEPAPSFLVSFSRAGHILGAACVKVRAEGKVIVFSGDLGRQNDLLMPPPEPILHADYLVVESTYGARVHEPVNVLEQLEGIINATIARGGVVLVPSFAIGRAQVLLYAIYLLRKANRIPHVPVYLNSPMAISATGLLSEFESDHKLSAEDCARACEMATYVRDAEESKTLNEKKSPMILIAASGMITGGRILHHLKAFGPDIKNTILLTGFQSAGTRGAALAAGAKEIKIHGQLITIAAEVISIDSLSAHADQEEILSWLGKFKKAPQMTFITHGEPLQANALEAVISDRLGWRCRIPREGETVSL
jgi:metallo-beta-lactamase family protein